MRPFIWPVIGFLATACAAPDKAGVRDPERFSLIAERSIVTSDRTLHQLARCFEEAADFLPMTRFHGMDAADGLTYRLRGFGHTFEEITFRASADGGSTATVLIAPNLNEQWRADFVQDRLEPLKACAASRG